jgi:hypothetical protein
MMPLADTPNGGIASAFCRDSYERASPTEIRANRMKLSNFGQQILATQTERDTDERSFREVELALKQSEEAAENAEPKVKERIQLEVQRRNDSLVRATENLRKLQEQDHALQRRVLDQESYFCRCELLDFLHSEGRYAVNPRPLAKALAGLPYMRWRQSYARCSKMSYRLEPREWYRTFAVIRKLWGNRRHADFNDTAVDLFRDLILNLPKKSYTRNFLATNWRDLRHAIEECWKAEHVSDSIPFIITANFVRNLGRPKGNVERVLGDQEKLFGL